MFLIACQRTLVIKQGKRPKYKTRTDTSEENKQMFENIDEASGYWKEL